MNSKILKLPSFKIIFNIWLKMNKATLNYLQS